MYKYTLRLTGDNDKARRVMRKYSTPKICVCCGTTVGRICIHHKNMVHEDNRRKNLEWMCMSCHSSYHVKRQHKNLDWIFRLKKHKLRRLTLDF